MAAVRMYIDKFKGVVLIEEDHPLAVAQRAKAASSVTRLDGKPLERGADGLVHGERAKSRELLESEAIPPKIDPSRSDEDLILQFTIEAIDRTTRRRRPRRLLAVVSGICGPVATDTASRPPACSTCRRKSAKCRPCSSTSRSSAGRSSRISRSSTRSPRTSRPADLVEQLTLKLTTPPTGAGRRWGGA
jgi:hypothetical protein